MFQQRGRVRTDDPLGEGGWLGEEEPRPVSQRGTRSHALELLERGHDVQDRHASDAVGVFERQAERNTGTPVVTDDSEARVTERSHDLDELARHLTLRVPLTTRAARCRLGGPVPTKIGADDVMSPCELGSDVFPAEMGLREPVQQQGRRTGTTAGNEVARLPDRQAPVHEARK